MEYGLRRWAVVVCAIISGFLPNSVAGSAQSATSSILPSTTTSTSISSSTLADLAQPTRSVVVRVWPLTPNDNTTPTPLATVYYWMLPTSAAPSQSPSLLPSQSSLKSTDDRDDAKKSSQPITGGVFLTFSEYVGRPSNIMRPAMFAWNVTSYNPPKVWSNIDSDSDMENETDHDHDHDHQQSLKQTHQRQNYPFRISVVDRHDRVQISTANANTFSKNQKQRIVLYLDETGHVWRSEVHPTSVHPSAAVYNERAASSPLFGLLPFKQNNSLDQGKRASKKTPAQRKRLRLLADRRKRRKERELGRKEKRRLWRVQKVQERLEQQQQQLELQNSKNTKNPRAPKPLSQEDLIILSSVPLYQKDPVVVEIKIPSHAPDQVLNPPILIQPVPGNNNKDGKSSSPSQPPPDERSFFQKYWWIISIFLLVQVISAVSKEEEPQQPSPNGRTQSSSITTKSTTVTAGDSRAGGAAAAAAGNASR